MNRTINQLVNALHLDPKREAAVRKIIENAGGVNDSTPVVTEVSGNELIPINQNGENKAVSAAALVKGSKEVYILDITNNKTDYNKLKEAVLNNKIIICNKLIFTGLYEELSDGDEGIFLLHSTLDASVTNIGINTVCIFVDEDGSCDLGEKYGELIITGDGTKFLSDDGTYKEISGGSGPVIIEYPYEGTEAITLTDEQIEAARNSNIKLKLTTSGTTNYLILTPYSIVIVEQVIEILVRRYFGEDITDCTYVIDLVNKTLSLPGGI